MRYIGITVFISILALLIICLGKLSIKHSDNQDIKLVSIFNKNEVLELKNMKGDKYYIINVFATWCETCLEEHKTLLEIADSKVIKIYGIVYFDTQDRVRHWLNNNGNPYSIVSLDNNSNIAKVLNISAVPETFVFNKDGKIVFHVQGNLTSDKWNNEIKPLIK